MDFKQLPYLKQRDFIDPYIRQGKEYHPLLNEKGNPWDTCMISARSMHLLFLKELFPESVLKTFHQKTIEEVYFQMVCDWIEENYLKKKKKASRYMGSIHTEMLNDNFAKNGIKYKYISCNATIDNAQKIISGQMPNAPAQPLIAGTDISNFINLKPGESVYTNGRGTPKGHIQLFVEVTKDGIISKDPYGKANTRYKDQDGNNVLYSNADLKFLLADYCKYNYIVKA